MAGQPGSLGITLDQVIGIAGLLATGEPTGSKFVPIATAVIGAAVAVLVERLIARPRNQPPR